MLSVKVFSQSIRVLLSIFLSLVISTTTLAANLEITSLIGYTFSPKLNSIDNTTSIPTTDEPNIALGLSWKDSNAGQGQILINYIGRDFTDNIDQSIHSFDTVYAHFNGIGFFKERNYITTVGMGIGMAYFKSDYDSVFYPSISISLGTRYEFSKSLALITELRAYATLTKDDDTLFCQNESTCAAHFDSSIWIDSQISIGLAYSF